MARSIAAAFLMVLVGALAGGCWQPTDNGGPDDPPEWELRDTPQHVLDNLVKAYKNKDAVHYLDCLAEDFIFFVNPDELAGHPELEPGSWGKAEERGIHEQMFGTEGDHADRIELTLSQIGDPIQVEPFPGGILWQYRQAVDLRITIAAMTYLASAPSLFEFRIDEDEVGPNGETLWEIISWYDLAPSQRGGSRQSRTWSSIKALFR